MGSSAESLPDGFSTKGSQSAYPKKERKKKNNPYGFDDVTGISKQIIMLM